MGKGRKQKKTMGRKRRSGATAGMAAAGPSCTLAPPTRQVYRFERTLYSGNLVAPVSDKGWVFGYTLGSFPGATEFTQLFDLYRMTALQITFTYVGTSQYNPTLHMLADYDTYTVPSTIDAVAQRPHKRITLTAANPAFTFKMKPRVLSVVQTTSGTASSALAPAGQWMDCNDSTVAYGGLIGWISQFSTTTNVTIAVTVRGLFDFAMVR